MNKIFSAKLYWQGLRKVRVVGLAMLFIVTALNALFPIVSIMSEPSYSSGIKTAEAGVFAPVGILLGLFAPLLVYSMFSYLNERRASDFFHSLPQKRACIFLSFMAAVVTWIVFTLFVTTLVNTLLWSLMGEYAVNLSSIMPLILGFLAFAMVTAGVMALAMTLTGTTVSNVFVFLLLFLFVRACGDCFIKALAEEARIFAAELSTLRFFDWNYFLPLVLLDEILGASLSWRELLPMLLYWFFLSIALIAVSAVCYCRRRSESATKSAPNRFMHALYRICMILPFLIVGVETIRLGGEIYLGLLFIFIGFLVWVIFEALTMKTVKNLVRTLPLLLIPAVLTGGYIASVHLAKAILYASTPQRDDIVSVKIEECPDIWKNTSTIAQQTDGLASAIFLNGELTDPKVLDEVHEMIELTKDTSSDFGGYLFSDAIITVKTKTGRRVSYRLRPYNMISDTFSRSDEFIRLVSEFDFDVQSIDCDLHIDGSMAVWEAFKEDFRALTDEQKKEYLHWNEQQMLATGRNILKIYGSYNGKNFKQVFNPIAEYTPNAYRLYMECLAEEGEVFLEKLRTAVNQLKAINPQKAYYVRMDILDPQGSFDVNCSDFSVIKGFLTEMTIDSHLIDYGNAGENGVCYLNLRIRWASEDGYVRGIGLEGPLTFSADDKAIYEALMKKLIS